MWEVIRVLREVDERGAAAMEAAAGLLALTPSRIGVAVRYCTAFEQQIDADIAEAEAASLDPGVQVAVEFDAASADHLTHLSDDDVAALAASRTVATLLPGAEFSTRAPYPDARRLLDAGATVALATDCNPGSSYTTNLPFCIAVAVRDMQMTPEEAVWAATAGGARALRRTDVGHLGPGARADVVVLDAPSPVHLAYRPGVPLIAGVWQRGARLLG